MRKALLNPNIFGNGILWIVAVAIQIGGWGSQSIAIFLLVIAFIWSIATVVYHVKNRKDKFTDPNIAQPKSNKVGLETLAATIGNLLIDIDKFALKMEKTKPKVSTAKDATSIQRYTIKKVQYDKKMSNLFVTEFRQRMMHAGEYLRQLNFITDQEYGRLDFWTEPSHPQMIFVLKMLKEAHLKVMDATKIPIEPSLKVTITRLEIGKALSDNGQDSIQFLISLIFKASPEIKLSKLDLVYDGRPYKPILGLPTSIVKGTESHEVEYRVYGDAGRLKILIGLIECGGASENQLPEVYLRIMAGELDFIESIRLVSHKEDSQKQ
jgi:hypothetical protein